MVTRACREFAVAHSAQLPAERLLGDRDAELLEDPLCKIDQPPTHHAMDCRNRTTLDHTGNGLALNIVEPGRLARRLTVQQTVRPMRVEAQHPVPDNLEPDPANLRRLGARRAIIDRRKSQKPTGLGAVFGLPCQTAELGRIEVTAEAYGNPHDEPPRFAMLNLTRLHLGIAPRVRISGNRYYSLARRSLKRHQCI